MITNELNIRTIARLRQRNQKYFSFTLCMVIAICSFAASPVNAALAPDADRTFLHPAENGNGNSADKNLTLTSGVTYTFRTDAEPDSHHVVDWFTTFSGGTPVESEHLYYYDDHDFTFSTSGWVRAEIYASNVAGTKGAWEASYRWYITMDTTSPTNPTSWSGSPAVNTWTTDNTIYVSWSGASDNVALKGYYYKWSTNSTDTVSTSDSYEADTDGADDQTSSSLVDGLWYFHVRYVDTSNYLASSTAHRGPFKIDRTAPGLPTQTSPSNNGTVTT